MMSYPKSQDSDKDSSCYDVLSQVHLNNHSLFPPRDEIPFLPPSPDLLLSSSIIHHGRTCPPYVAPTKSSPSSFIRTFTRAVTGRNHAAATWFHPLSCALSCAVTHLFSPVQFHSHSVAPPKSSSSPSSITLPRPFQPVHFSSFSPSVLLTLPPCNHIQ
jgi:hypothetical protein